MLVCKYEVDWLSQLSYRMQAVSQVTRCKLVQILIGSRIGLFAAMSNLVLGPTHPPVQFIPGLKGPYHAADQLTFT